MAHSHLALVLATSLAASLAACAKDKPPADEGAIAARAQAALAPFKGGLKSELTSALAKGPDTAIDVCAIRAPALAIEHSKDGVRVGRSSSKLRNPANAPPSWLVPVMGDLAKTPSGSTEHRLVPLPDGRWGYAEPIWVQAPCLTCHGDNLAPDLDAKLRERYPADVARDFHVGDFRGVFYAEVDAAKP